MSKIDVMQHNNIHNYNNKHEKDSCIFLQKMKSTKDRVPIQYILLEIIQIFY